MNNEVKYKVCDGFTDEDLHQPGYTQPLRVASASVEGNIRELNRKAAFKGFRPDIELEYCRNGLMGAVRELFEEVAAYEEGRVPQFAAEDALEAILQHFEMLKGTRKAPILELDAAEVALREAVLIWERNYPQPRMERRTYLKNLFMAEREFFKCLRAVHAMYVKVNVAAIAARSRKRKVVKLDSAARQRKDDRRRVFQEITRLRKEKGFSTRKALQRMHQIGTWSARLGHLSLETWRRYYNSSRQ